MRSCFYLNKKWVVENKFNFTQCELLIYIYNWIFSKNAPERIYTDGVYYFYISQNYLVNEFEGLLSRALINRFFSKLKQIELIDSTFKSKNKIYYSFNWEIVTESIAKESDLPKGYKIKWWNKIKWYESKSYNTITKEEENMLFDMNEEKPHYSEESYAIVCRIINKCKDSGIFSHRVAPYGDPKQTKLLNDSCKYIQMIYDGKFINPRLYPFSEKFLSNKQFVFDISECKEILNDVKGDWIKVKKLIFSALDHFKLMFEEDRVPCDKKYLTKSLSNWFYAMCYDEAGKYQSQFLQSFKEPDFTSKFYSETKADKIFDKMNSKSQDYGEKIIDLAPNMPAGKAWENMKNMVEWAELVKLNEPNAGYWISSPSEILKLYYEFMVASNIIPSVNTLDVSYRPESGKEPPFVWFIKNAIHTHKMDTNLVNLITVDDFTDYYKPELNHPNWYDMTEVVF